MSKYEDFAKKFVDWASIGGGTIFPRSLSSFMNPLYESIVFQKLDPLTASGMALCVDLGPKCKNLFCLV